MLKRIQEAEPVPFWVWLITLISAYIGELMLIAFR